EINVIDQLLVTQVTSRQLTLQEIQDKGIVIDESSFTAFNFAIGLTLGTEKIQIDLPVIVPNAAEGVFGGNSPPQLPAVSLPPSAFEKINIPNFSISGFQMKAPPEIDEKDAPAIPAIDGVIIIPGNIAFLHEFFSVVLQAGNTAPLGSGLVLQNAKAQIVLPNG